MPRIDQQGNVHPTMDDQYGAPDALAHIGRCPECRETFPHVSSYLPSPPHDEALLDEAVTKYVRLGATLASRVPGTAVVAAKPIKTPVILFLILTLVTVGFWIIPWIVWSCFPKQCRTTLTVVNGQVAAKRNWSYS